MEKYTLHIDGEYLRKTIVEMDDLKKSLKKILGEVGYPTHLIYYGANKVSKYIISRLGELDIPNLKINTDGYIAILSDGRKVQKGVDSTIVVNVLRDDSEGVYLLSGDGDMFPIAKAYSEDKKKRLVTLSFKESTAEELKKYSNHFYLDLEEGKASMELSLEKIEKIIYRAWIKESKGDRTKYLTSTRLGQLGSEDPTFKLSGIKKIFLRLAEKDYIEVKKSNESKNPDTFIRFINTIEDQPMEKLSLLKGGEELDGEKILGIVIDEYNKNDKHYFFIKSGKRKEEIYLNYREISEDDRDSVKIGTKLSFDLASGKGKSDIAKSIEVICNA